MAKRKARIDSAAEAVRVMAKATTEILPPPNVDIDEEDMPFFRSVIAEFARSEWSDHQLELAGMLARKMRDMNDVQKDLRTQGYTAVTANGSPCQNPLVGVLRMLDTSILATRRSLSLHARATQGEARDTAKRREAAKEIEGDNPLEDDDLLARPR
ncbi:terminase small subunit [Endobacterium cereale]|uniref:terminase small subunit n=1 Tax=Endobacterium cereale TaxID=2663029 RepID=UPI002B484F6B|nr:terminase small subunit [Endobacterium cereale]MEB2845916.1 terminase small subunit [Endobacterium cereale]